MVGLTAINLKKATFNPGVAADILEEIYMFTYLVTMVV